MHMFGPKINTCVQCGLTLSKMYLVKWFVLVDGDFFYHANSILSSLEDFQIFPFGIHWWNEQILMCSEMRRETKSLKTYNEKPLTF